MAWAGSVRREALLAEVESNERPSDIRASAVRQAESRKENVEGGVACSRRQDQRRMDIFLRATHEDGGE